VESRLGKFGVAQEHVIFGSKPIHNEWASELRAIKGDDLGRSHEPEIGALFKKTFTQPKPMSELCTVKVQFLHKPRADNVDPISCQHAAVLIL